MSGEKLMRDEELRNFIAEKVMFTHEAVQYLNISPQRLHQLVQSGKLAPIKHSRSGSIFLKSDIEDRKRELVASVSIPDVDLEKDNVLVKSGVIQEAINYFTLQSLCKWSPKRTQPLFDKLSAYFDMTESLLSNIDQVSLLLDMDTAHIQKSYTAVSKGFLQLSPNTHIVKLGQDAYPSLLALTNEAPLFLFMRGNLRLANMHCVAVVGTRNPSEDGLRKAAALSELLGKFRIVVASGLAKGIDRAAHEGALASNTQTIGVIGTPITKAYPKENQKLQDKIAEEGLLISQFAPSSPVQRWNFPMRNAVMSGISLATVVIQAGETSGALIQADYALKQDRFVFIPQSAVEDEGLKWPRRYVEEKGAIAFRKIDDLIRKLEDSRVIETPRPVSSLLEEGPRYVR